MSNEISWPTKPFYIQSKLNRSNQVLMVDEHGSLVFRPLTGTIEQLWTATPDPRGGAVLRSVNTGKVLTCELMQVPILPSRLLPVSPLTAQPLDTAKPTQLWRVESLGDKWVGINSYLNWEMKLNIAGEDFNRGLILYHWDGGADNEEWCLIEENGELTLDDIVYDLGHAVADLGMPPTQCAAITIGGDAEVQGTYSLARSVTTQRTISNSVSDTEGYKYTQTFSIKGGIEKIVEVSASASFEESSSKTISLTDQKTTAETKTDTISVQAKVPAGKKYAYNVAVYYGKVTVPYTATMTFKSTAMGAKPVQVTTRGTFTGVNSTKCDIVVLDATPANDGRTPALPDRKVVESIPVN